MAFESAPAVQIGFRAAQTAMLVSQKYLRQLALNPSSLHAAGAAFGAIAPTQAASSRIGAAFKVRFNLPGTLGDMGLGKWPFGPYGEVFFGGEENEWKRLRAQKMNEDNLKRERSVLKVMGQPVVFHFILFCDFFFFGLILGGACIFKAFSIGVSNTISFSITFIIGLGALSLAFHSIIILLGKSKSPKYLIQSVFASTGLWLVYIYSIKIYAAIRVDNIPYIFESSGYLELVLFAWTMWNIVYFNQNIVEKFIEERYLYENRGL